MGFRTDVAQATVTVTEEVDRLRLDWLESHLTTTIISRELLESLIESENERRALAREVASLRRKLENVEDIFSGRRAYVFSDGGY